MVSGYYNMPGGSLFLTIDWLPQLLIVVGEGEFNIAEKY